MSRKMIGLLLMLLPSLSAAHEVPDVLPMLRRIESGCPGYANLHPYQELKELQGLTQAKDWLLYMDMANMDWVPMSHSAACKQALLQNIMDGMDFLVRTLPADSRWIDMARRDSAAANLTYAVLAQPADKQALIAKGNQLMRVYVEQQSADDSARSMNYYFASHAYIAAAAEAAQPGDAQAMLVQAVSIAREGLSKASDKQKIVEPLAIALGEQAKRLPKGSPEYRHVVEESLSTFELVRGVDPLAPYNIAVDRMLLGDFDAARTELSGMAAAGTINNQVCRGLISDPDMKPLLTDNKDWYIAFVKSHCAAMIQKAMSSQQAAPPLPSVPTNR